MHGSVCALTCLPAPPSLPQRRFVPWYDERFKGYRKNKVCGSAAGVAAAPVGVSCGLPCLQACCLLRCSCLADV